MCEDFHKGYILISVQNDKSIHFLLNLKNQNSSVSKKNQMHPDLFNTNNST